MGEDDKKEEKEESVFDSLKAQHQDFVLAYIEERHAGTAYGKVYNKGEKTLSYMTCAVNGHKLLNKANIKAAITEKLNDLWENRQADIGKVFDELNALAFSDIRTVMNFEEDGTFSVADLTGIDTRSIKKLKIRKEPSKKVGDETVEGADIIEIELYDKKSALVELSEILKMKEQKGIQITFVSDEAAKAVLAKHGL